MLIDVTSALGGRPTTPNDLPLHAALGPFRICLRSCRNPLYRHSVRVRVVSPWPSCVADPDGTITISFCDYCYTHKLRLALVNALCSTQLFIQHSQ